jgi:hypothetical protein
VPVPVLILAPGCVWEGPLDLPLTKDGIDAHLTAWRERFQNAMSVVLAGGGPVGSGPYSFLSHVRQAADVACLQRSPAS